MTPNELTAAISECTRAIIDASEHPSIVKRLLRHLEQLLDAQARRAVRKEDPESHIYCNTNNVARLWPRAGT